MYRALGNVAKGCFPFSGVYMITNTTNGKCYIGSSFNIGQRLYEHKQTLVRGNHHNIHLQRAYREYGEGSFIVEDLEICLPKDRISAENRWLQCYKGDKYNIAFRADCPSQAHLSKETRQKISEGLKKGIDKTQRSRELKARWQTLEWQALMKKIHCGRKYSPSSESIEKMRKAIQAQYDQGRIPWNKGKPTPKHVRQKQSKARLGKEPANKGKKWDKERKCYA